MTKEKDPAVLFFVKDFMTGSSLLTPLQKGHYITLLCHQQQSDSGSLTIETVKKIMGKDFIKQWPALIEKFKEDDSGFYNVRMRKEMDRRKKNSKIQKDKIEKYWDSVKQQNIQQYIQRNNNGNTIYATATEIEKERGDVGGNGSWNTMPGPEALKLILPEIKIGAAIQFFAISKNIQTNEKQVLGLWEIFKIQNFTGKKYYASEADTHSHFLNSLKNQTINLGEKASGSKPMLTPREIRAQEILKEVHGQDEEI